MQYISTRGNDTAGFSSVVLSGLARDGGLFLPQTIPDVTAQLDSWQKLSYQELAYEIMRLYVDLSEKALRGLIRNAYASFTVPEITPVKCLDDIYVLELFHGPTLAFKDVALQFLGGLFENLLAGGDKQLNIIAATSGDTGSAAIHGVKGRKHIRILVLYPHGRVSPSQELQMITVADSNVFTLAVEGDFDDCQKIVKTLLADLAFKDQYSLGAVNSINWARILAQIVYYFYAGLSVMQKTGSAGVRFSVPTGNFGDIFAGYIAQRMGLPIQRLVLATNENDILARFFQTGVYQRGPAQATISPSMDIQVASNFERYLYYRFNANPQCLTEAMGKFASTGQISVPLGTDGVDPLFNAASVNTEATLKTIREYYTRHDYLLDPHTATGVCAARQFLCSTEPMICLATAHPAKFGSAIEQALGENVACHPALDSLTDLPVRRQISPATVESIRNFIVKMTVVPT